MRGGSGILNVIEVQPTESNRINLSIFPQHAGLICLLDQVKGLNGWCSAAILSDLNTLNLARSLRQIIYLFRSSRVKLQTDAGSLQYSIEKTVRVAGFAFFRLSGLLYNFYLMYECQIAPAPSSTPETWLNSKTSFPSETR